jgi:hypothetical protein
MHLCRLLLSAAASATKTLSHPSITWIASIEAPTPKDTHLMRQAIVSLAQQQVGSFE